MVAFENSTRNFDEPKSARLEARTQPSVKEAISRAAALNGVELSSFVVSAAYRAAQETIEAHRLTVLDSAADRAAFFDALEHPPMPNKRLREAFALRETLISNAD
ncbi:hypothetical protein BMG00_17235 [Thioclava marina]|uniref:DUF1778 domain-containing protein n=1 Tax=Thioclava marina TaxID=1915077 RepID=A0ABX3MH39_9RHOB|nr:DUF1778 domain-containing protein [Thioclava marina]OOY10899.1 hypothetical protein BMG00_17235 [Thioclava marina]